MDDICFNSQYGLLSKPCMANDYLGNYNWSACISSDRRTANDSYTVILKILVRIQTVGGQNGK